MTLLYELILAYIMLYHMIVYCIISLHHSITYHIIGAPKPGPRMGPS